MKDYDIMYNLCKGIFLIGGGNYWYDKAAIGNEKTALYRVLSFLLYSSYFMMTFLEIMAAAIGDISEEERCHAISHGVSHVFYLLKIICTMVKQEPIRKFIKEMVEVCQSLEEESTSKTKYNSIKFVMGAYCSCLYGAVIFYLIQGFLYVLSGENFFVIITYYGTPDDDSLVSTCVRIGTTVTIVLMMSTMTVTVDGLVISLITIFKYKFILLKKHFEQLHDKMTQRISQRGCDINAASNELFKGLKKGIIMHQTLLRLAKDLDDCLGAVMTIQLFSSSFPAVFLLLQMAVSGNTDIVYLLKIFAFITTVFFLLGTYLCTIGDITCEASSLPDSIFFCGWHLVPSSSPSHRKVRALVLLSCAQSQLPIVIKAFNMVHLTHATYVEVIRSTYSVYALLQAQN